jgi:GNAT superfamily N-acetyltransferase
MAANVFVRGAKLEDFNFVFGLLVQLWPDKTLNKYHILKVYEQGLESKNNKFLCAEVRGEVVGFCSFCRMLTFWQEGYIGYIPELIIDENNRGQGVGRALMEAVIEAAKESGCGLIALDSGFHRERAHLFYESMGFKKMAYLLSMEL